MNERLQFDIDSKKREILLTLNEELESRFHFLPREIHPGENQLCLSSDPEVIKKEIEAARKAESTWPQQHYLWALNPVMDWLNDRMLSAFGRHEAPVIRLDSLGKFEVIVLMSGLIPNRQGHPLVHEWFGVRFMKKKSTGVMEFDEVLSTTGFRQKKLPNRNSKTMNTGPYAELLQEAVNMGTRHVEVCRKKFLEKYLPQVEAKLKELDALRSRHQQQYSLDLEQNKNVFGLAKTKRENRMHQIEQAFKEYRVWIDNTMKLEKQAHLQVLAVFAGE